MKFSQIKILTKGILNGKTKSFSPFILGAILTVVLFTALSFAITLITSNSIIIIIGITLLSLVYFMLISGFRSGSLAWFHFYKSHNKSRRSLFWFSPKRELKSTAFYFNIFLRKLLWTAFLALPGGFTLFSFVLLAMDGGIEFNLFLCGVIGGTLMLLLGLVFRFIIIQKYFLASFYLIENPKIKINEAIKKSVSAMNGKLKKTALFKLSFTPWFSLCLSLFPIIYVLPYYKQSCFIYANELKSNNFS